MWPAIIAGGALLGASIGGGLLSQSSRKKEQQRDRDWQQQQMEHGIEWRAEDAKRAGIHPLYAMGANIQSPSPLHIGGGEDLGSSISSMGQSMAQISNRFQTPAESTMQAANIKVLASEATKNDAMARFYDSQAMNPQPSSAGAASFSTDPAGNIQPQGLNLPGQVTFKAPDVMSTNPADISKTAGRNPGYMKIDIDPNMSMEVPYTQEGLGEALENLGPMREPGNAMRTANQYGDLRWEWMKDYYRKMFFGQPPSRNWNKVPKPGGYYYAPTDYSGVKDSVGRTIEQWKNVIRPGWRKLKKSFNQQREGR